MLLNLSNCQLKIDGYIYRLIYMNLMVTANQKPTMDTQKIKRKESEQKTKGIHQATGKRPKEENRSY